MLQCNISLFNLRRRYVQCRFVQFTVAQFSHVLIDIHVYLCKTAREILVMMTRTLIEKQVSEFIC